MIINNNNNPSKKAIAEHTTSFFVNFDFGGFLKCINKSEPNQKIIKINHPR